MSQPSLNKIKLPARVVYQLDRQISDLETLIAKKQRRLDELRLARKQVEKE